MLCWQRDLCRECQKTWYGYNVVQKQNSETRLRAVASRCLIFSISPVTYTSTLAVVVDKSSALSAAVPSEDIICSCFPMYEQVSWELCLTCFRTSSKYLLFQPFKLCRAILTKTRWESIRMSNSTSSSECSCLWGKGVRTGVGDAVIPSPSTAATDVNFCSVCACLSGLKVYFEVPCFLFDCKCCEW